VSTALANFLFEAVNFLLLAAALGWVLFKPVRRALDAERARHDKDLEDAARVKREAEARLQEAAGARAKLEAASTAEAKKRLDDAGQQAARIVEEARAAADEERRAFEREQEARRQAEAVALAGTVGRIAGESVVRLLRSLDGPALDLALVRAACEELRKLPRPAAGTVLVESARGLDPDSKKLLAAALGDGFQARELPALGAGVRVTLPGGKIEASAAALAREAAGAVVAAGPAADLETT